MSSQSDDERDLIARLRGVSPPIEVRTRIRARVVAQVAAGAALGAASGSAAAAKTGLISAGVGAKGLALIGGGALLLAVGIYVAVRGATPATGEVAAPSATLVATAPARRELPQHPPNPVPPESALPRAVAVVPRGSAQAGGTLEDELRLLGQAQSAMSTGNWQQALTELESHRSRFPRGALAGERNGLRVVALCRSGAVEAGRAEGRRLLAGSPGSTLAARIRAACGL
jgi:hypothetical protein